VLRHNQALSLQTASESAPRAPPHRGICVMHLAVAAGRHHAAKPRLLKGRLGCAGDCWDCHSTSPLDFLCFSRTEEGN